MSETHTKVTIIIENGELIEKMTFSDVQSANIDYDYAYLERPLSDQFKPPVLDYANIEFKFTARYDEINGIDSETTLVDPAKDTQNHH